MRRRNFLGSLAGLPAVALLPLGNVSTPANTERKPSQWLEVLDQGIDPQSILTIHGQPIKIVSLAGAMLCIPLLDRMFSELSGDATIKLFPKSPWKGCHILSTAVHLSSYMSMRYELTADKDNAELDRAHEGADWKVDSRIADHVILLESANGQFGLFHRAANYRW